MYRVTGSTWGTVAIGVVAVFLVAGIVGVGLLGAPHAASGLTAKGSPAGSAGAHAAPIVPAAQTYQTTIDLSFNTSLPYEALPAITATPTTYTLYSNITYGSISNANTNAWATVFNTTLGTITITLNGTVNTANVHTFVNNGVTYENYTWTLTLSKATLGCTVASCADLFPAGGYAVLITVFMTENGASEGGGLASTSTVGATTMVSTFVSAGFVAPTSMLDAVPFVVEFWTNISWGYTSNASTSVNLEVSYAAVTLNFSWNGTVNTTHSHLQLSYPSSANVYNGTVAGVPYTEVTWWMTFNKTNLACTTTSCNTTFTTGAAVSLSVWVTESGTNAGGLATTGELMVATTTITVGSTLINAGENGAPLFYQPLPYVATGWLNVSWVNPKADLGNSTITGYVQFYDGLALLGSFSLNDSVNTTNSAGVSLMTAFNGTTPLGIPYLNYTWTWDLTATAASLGANVGYVPYLLVVNVSAAGNGAGLGGWNVYTGPTPVITTVFVQYPSSVSAAFTAVCPASGACAPTFTAYEQTPFTVNFTVTVGNAPISPANTVILVNVSNANVGLVTSNPISPLPGQTNYVFPIDPTTLACSSATCGDLPQTEYSINIAVVVDGISLPTNGSIAYTNISHGFFLITVPLSASLISPVPGAAVSVGNVTTSVAYVGSWVAGVVLNIYSSSHALVFSHSFIELTPGVPVSATWFIGSTGMYNYSIVVTTVYLIHGSAISYFNGTLTITTKGGTVYLNTSKWSNQTVLPGLSGAASGTLLLIVGLIVGMLVALIFGRAIWGGRPASQPPQAWQGQGQPGQPGAPGTNTCSVCGKSFATPDELAAHGKSEHGMQ